MDYEKKYREALKKAEAFYFSATTEPITEREVLANIFPELKDKDSEDERIREELIELISYMHDADPRKKGWIAWLEKQDNQKPQGKSALEAAKEEKVDNQTCVKPSDKVEPKFHEGDFIVNDYCMGKVKENRYDKRRLHEAD